MRVLVTGSSGHLGEALLRSLRDASYEVRGLDVLPGPGTDHIGSVSDRTVVREAVAGVECVIHAATLHKPHLDTHTWQQFVDVNVTGTLTVLQEAVAAGVRTFVYTSTTSAFGRTLSPRAGLPAAWVTEDLRGLPRNVYGVTKATAEDLCELIAQESPMRCVVLRTSRFFPEADDQASVREEYDSDNAKVNELLYRRVDLADVVDVHLLALQAPSDQRFARFVVSAPTPFRREHLADLRRDAPAVLASVRPDHKAVYEALGWRMFPSIDRVYVSDRARRVLGWSPSYTFDNALESLAAGADWRSPLARSIGWKGYHREAGQAATT